MRAFGSILDVPVPIPIPQPWVCKDPTSGITCPVKKDQEIEYKNTMKLEKKTPAVIIVFTISSILSLYFASRKFKPRHPVNNLLKMTAFSYHF